MTTLLPSTVTSGTYTFTDPPVPPAYPKWFTGLDVGGVTVVIGGAWQESTGLEEDEVVNLLLCTNSPYDINNDGNGRKIYFNETGDYYAEPDTETNRLQIQWALYPNNDTITTSTDFSYISIMVSAGYYSASEPSTYWAAGWAMFAETSQLEEYPFRRFFESSGEYYDYSASTWMFTKTWLFFDTDVFTALEPYSGGGE